MPTRRIQGRPGFTLIEMLVVITIIGIISASVIAVVLPALGQQQVSGSARILQAKLASARDSAIQSNAPRGIRLLPDPVYSASMTYPIPPGVMFASNRMIDIQAAPDYSEGVADYGGMVPVTPPLAGFLWVYGPTAGAGGVPLSPTSWYWNIRKGEKIRFANAGPIYTIVGPMAVPNPEGFINEGAPGTAPTLIGTYPAPPGPPIDTTWGVPEVLWLVNGLDDNGNGYVDEGADGLDNNGDGTIDEPAENEPERLVTTLRRNSEYTISRRPVPVAGSTETALLSGVEIDLTTATAPVQERSRLPIDRFTGYVDILMGSDGQVIQAGPYAGVSGSSPPVPFYHFWLCERRDVHEASPGHPYLLPMPRGAPNYTDEGERNLKGQRRLITLSTRTGLVTTNSIELFDGLNRDLPFIDAQRGVREPQ